MLHLGRHLVPHVAGWSEAMLNISIMRENWRSILLYILSNAVSGQFQACNYSFWCSIQENCCLLKRTPLHLVVLSLISTVCSVTGAAGCVASHPLDTIKVIILLVLFSYNVVCGVKSSFVHFDICIVVQAFNLDNVLLQVKSVQNVLVGLI